MMTCNDVSFTVAGSNPLSKALFFIYFKLNKLGKSCSVVQCLFIYFFKFCNKGTCCKFGNPYTYPYV